MFSKNCLKEFTSVPDRYFCYCGKEENPEFDPWLPPHSCGNICGRVLPCGHTCNERCHAGRCPPCPRIVTVTCPCGKTKQTVRCSMQHLESAIACCSLPCLKRLPCGRHLCKAKCHSGPCPPCSAVIHQKCFCGSAERDVPCSEAEGPSYSCGRICGRPLACGHHTCPLPCHDGPCPPCPNQPPRTCFCGKKRTPRQQPSPQSTPSPARSRRHPATRSATSCFPAATAVPRSATRRPVPPACSSCGRPVAAAVRRRRSPARSHSSVTSSVRSCATAVAIAAVAAAATVIIRSARR